MNEGQIKARARRFAILSAVKAALLITLVVFGVLLAYRVPWKYDMTAQQLFTLSEQSTTILDGLQEPVRIGAVYPKGQEEMMVESLLDEYVKATPNVSVEYIDAEREPARLAAYALDVAAVPNGTIIVQGARRTRMITNTSLFKETPAGNVFTGEQEITGAIRYVTTDELPVVYFMEGHEEALASDRMTTAVSALQLNAFEVKTFHPIQTGKVPDDASIVIVPSPKTDITAQEGEMLEAYLQKGGKLFLMIDSVMNTNDIVLTNWNQLCHLYGIDIGNNYVVEEDQTAYLSTNRLVLLPAFAPHEITTPMAAARKVVVLPVVRGLGSVEYDKTTVERDILLMSSAKSWVRVDMTILEGSQTAADLQGPLPLAYAATGSNVKWGNPASRIVVIGNSSFCNNDYMEAQANKELFMNCVNWLQGDRSADIVAEKVINADKLLVTGGQFIRLAVICVAVLPFIAFLGAFMVWYLRRHQ